MKVLYNLYRIVFVWWRALVQSAQSECLERQRLPQLKQPDCEGLLQINAFVVR